MKFLDFTFKTIPPFYTYDIIISFHFPKFVNIGEYKIGIQLAQLLKDYYHLNDILINNTGSSSGYSQIDHVVLTPYGIFVIETKNYQGTIYGQRIARHGW
ncbi:nuclease-related domain-containing protein [Peribacillus deserti]|uniref:NERD domain-containing protein n=1 Tax=Peribacillus deserti TaxID=673318 RepID=A0A2N5M1F1_9BACI|nr:hypothetical protein CUU66_19700 [Peribacillus deserti]